MSENYARRGVSAGKEDVHFAISQLDKGLYPNAFCKILPDMLAGDPEYCNIMHADGTGTKSSLAYLYWKETGDLDVWRQLAKDALVMNTDDMLCAGVYRQFLFSNTIGRNKFYIPREVLAAILEGMEEFFAMLRKYDIEAINTGGETADLGDLVKTIVYDATAFSRIPRSEVITNDDIAAGQVIVGLSSSGQAEYETEYNSGIGSNGLTNARHDMLAHKYAELYPESFDANIPEDLVYAGPHDLTDEPDQIPLSVGKLLLSPTRTYLPVMKTLLEKHKDKIKGMIHCTGGGQTKVLKFVSGIHVIKDNLFPTPPVFSMIQAASGSSWQEMYKVFNMGHRLEIFTEESNASLFIDAAQKMGVDAQVIGRCERSEENRLSIRSNHGTFEYNSH